MNFGSRKCLICGDRASGIAYEVLTCRSCKVFYHRYADKFEKLKCYNEESCIVTVESRHRCGKCRLAKCKQAGMIKKTIAQNKNDQLEPELKSNYLDQIIQTNTVKLQTDEQNNNKLVRFEFPIPEIRDRKHHHATDLTPLERTLISEIQNARSVFADETSVRILRPTSQVIEIFKIPDIYFRWTIKFCKKFSAFNALSAEDQYIILKPYCFDILAINCGFIYSKEKNGYPMFENDTGNHAIFVIYNVAEGMTNYRSLINFNIKFWTSLHEEMENDVTIRDLLSAQLLFISRDGLSCPEFLRHQYFTYSHLLLRYLEYKYKSLTRARQKFQRLMRVLRDLPRIKENERFLFAEFDLNNVPQLVVEIYNLL